MAMESKTQDSQSTEKNEQFNLTLSEQIKFDQA
jgi:hypothetical protein